ncbi:translation initiation factor IF-2-like [Vidua chalybeata]|uniref:translation initiation factor IF-2-like n=1 Tax=Vidua chalybeata TaxID=81927 RepID=UPI0023A90D6B|nr:translation initiation factor IF-2-like [Vidua chalybeata]
MTRGCQGGHRELLPPFAGARNAGRPRECSRSFAPSAGRCQPHPSPAPLPHQARARLPFLSPAPAPGPGPGFPLPLPGPAPAVISEPPPNGCPGPRAGPAAWRGPPGADTPAVPDGPHWTGSARRRSRPAPAAPGGRGRTGEEGDEVGGSGAGGGGTGRGPGGSARPPRRPPPPSSVRAVRCGPYLLGGGGGRSAVGRCRPHAPWGGRAARRRQRREPRRRRLIALTAAPPPRPATPLSLSRETRAPHVTARREGGGVTIETAVRMRPPHGPRRQGQAGGHRDGVTERRAAPAAPPCGAPREEPPQRFRGAQRSPLASIAYCPFKI